jgi:translin
VDEVLAELRDARRRLEAKDEVRDRMLNAKRGVTSKARESINEAQQGRLDDARSAYEDALEQVQAIRADLDEDPDLRHSGALRNALQEVAEAWVLLSLGGEDEAMTAEAFVLGVGDAVGELRRHALDALIDQDPGEAEERLAGMETLYEELRTIDVPSGVVDLKHEVDVARTLVDKTRGKIALGRIEQRLTRLDRDASLAETR